MCTNCCVVTKVRGNFVYADYFLAKGLSGAASQNEDTWTDRAKKTSEPTAAGASQTAKSAQGEALSFFNQPSFLIEACQPIADDNGPPDSFVKFVAGSNDEGAMQDTRDMLSYFQGG